MTPTRLPRPIRLATNAVKLAVVAMIVLLGWIDSGTSAAPWPPTPYAGPQGYVDQGVDPDGRTSRLLAAHSCSTTGFDTSQQPLSAVVRTGSGRLRFVDFDTGWAVFTRDGRATLVAVCLDEPPLG